MKMENVSLQNRLYAATFVVMVILLSVQFSLLNWTTRFATNRDNFPGKPPSKKVEKAAGIPFNGKRFYDENQYKFITSITPKLCSPPKKPFIVVFVSSAPGHRDRRDAIRSTWGSDAELEPSNALVIFLLGKSNENNPSLESGISEEIDTFGDILQIDFVDSYLNLTIKSISAVRWTVENCPLATYLMKTDDDIYVNVSKLKDFLESRKTERRIYGCIKTHAFGQPLKRDKDGSMTKDYSFAGGHPPFAAGAGYVVSGLLLQDLYSASTKLPLYPIEDVFITGRCGKSIGQSPFHDGRFSCGEALPEDCNMALRFTGHWVKPDRQRIIYSKMKNKECTDSNI